jgi:hypothetical protein
MNYNNYDNGKNSIDQRHVPPPRPQPQPQPQPADTKDPIEAIFKIIFLWMGISLLLSSFDVFR